MSQLLQQEESKALHDVLFDYLSGTAPSSYNECNLDRLHLASSKVNDAGENIRQRNAYRRRENWPYDREWDLSITVSLLKATIRHAPHSLDWGYDNDGAGYTRSVPEPTFSTDWVRVGRDRGFVRVSQARTAFHSFSVLRTPIDGNGVALELTQCPTSSDPRQAVTVLVFQPERDIDKNRPWIDQRDARVFDLREYRGKPYTAGPLYNGFPNEITDPIRISQIILAMREVVKLILER